MDKNDKELRMLLDRIEAADIAMNEIVSLMEANTRTNIIPLNDLLVITENYAKSILECDERFIR